MKKRKDYTNPCAYRWAKVLLHVHHNQGALDIWVGHVGSVTLVVSMLRYVALGTNSEKRRENSPTSGGVVGRMYLVEVRMMLPGITHS